VPEGVCLYQGTFAPGAPTWPTWLGLGAGNSYSVTVPPSYPSVPPFAYCNPTLPSPFRFSWSINVQPDGPTTFILIGQQALPTADPSCPFAPGAEGTADEAFVYMVLSFDTLAVLQPATCLLQINSMAKWKGSWTSKTPLAGQAYPSLLDPASPGIAPGDLNYQYSGQSPFLYYTRLNPAGPNTNNKDGNDRDLVRVPLNVQMPSKAR
jgi:hypothetical protein